jgi:hypothetical protein
VACIAVGDRYSGVDHIPDVGQMVVGSEVIRLPYCYKPNVIRRCRVVWSPYESGEQSVKD